MTGKGQRDVGFLARNVGSMAGFLEEPDTRFPNRISRLGRECRKCRVLIAGEICQEFEKDCQLRSRSSQSSDNTGLA
jgi:hypothetical protein